MVGPSIERLTAVSIERSAPIDEERSTGRFGDPTVIVSVGIMLERFITGARSLAWLLAAAVAACMASERLYWYWGGIDPDSVGVLGAFYAVATAVAFGALATVGSSGWRTVVIGGAFFALTVEGVITPVMYEDGPLPVLFLMFVGWHGVLAFGVFVVLFRRLALDRRRLALAFWASGTGAVWGVWALASSVTDRDTAEEMALDGGSSEVLTPAEFLEYGLWVALTLGLAHVVMDRCWPDAGWRMSRSGVVATGLACLFLTLTMVVPAVFWAPIKLVAIGWVVAKVARRHGSPGGSTVIDALGARIRVRDLAPLLAMPLTAAAVYAALWPMRDLGVMTGVFWSAIGAQVVVGVVAMARSARPEAHGDSHRCGARPFGGTLPDYAARP